MDLKKFPNPLQKIKQISPDNEFILKELARKYVWWKTPEEALKFPQHVFASVMDMGTFDDVETLAGMLGDEILKTVLTQAEAGQFRPRSWFYWHYRLYKRLKEQVPAMPVRKFE